MHTQMLLLLLSTIGAVLARSWGHIAAVQHVRNLHLWLCLPQLPESIVLVFNMLRVGRVYWLNHPQEHVLVSKHLGGHVEIDYASRTHNHELEVTPRQPRPWSQQMHLHDTLVVVRAAGPEYKHFEKEEGCYRTCKHLSQKLLVLVASPCHKSCTAMRRPAASPGSRWRRSQTQSRSARTWSAWS